MILVPGQGSHNSDRLTLLYSLFFPISLGTGMVGKAVGSEFGLVIK